MPHLRRKPGRWQIYGMQEKTRCVSAAFSAVGSFLLRVLLPVFGQQCYLTQNVVDRDSLDLACITFR